MSTLPVILKRGPLDGATRNGSSLPISTKRKLTSDDLKYLEENDKRANEAHTKWLQDKEDMIKQQEKKNAHVKDDVEFMRRLELFDEEQKRLVDKWKQRKNVEKEMQQMKRVEDQVRGQVERLRRKEEEEASGRRMQTREKKFDPSFDVTSDPLSGPPVTSKKNAMASSKPKRKGIALPPLQ